MLGNPPMTTARQRVQLGRNRLRRWTGAALLVTASSAAYSYTANLTAGSPAAVYLQIGVGSFTNAYIDGGQPGNNTSVQTVSLSVPSTVVGNGSAQTMTTNSTQSISHWDNYAFCNVPGQMFIGGFYRTAGGNTVAAKVTATVPAALIDATGDTIPFSKIQWTSSGNGDSGTEIFPSGIFVNGAVQNVGSMASNTWNESCWTFSYLNNTIPPAGTFTGTVRYTLTAP
jgi:hypothetical protein